MSAICPECDSPIDVDEFDVDIGDELTCSECGSLLRVASDSPLEFEIADEEDDLVPVGPPRKPRPARCCRTRAADRPGLAGLPDRDRGGR